MGGPGVVWEGGASRLLVRRRRGPLDAPPTPITALLGVAPDVRFACLGVVAPARSVVDEIATQIKRFGLQRRNARMFRKKSGVAFAHHAACCRVVWSTEKQQNGPVSAEDRSYEEVPCVNGRGDADGYLGWLPAVQLVSAGISVSEILAAGRPVLRPLRPLRRLQRLLHDDQRKFRVGASDLAGAHRRLRLPRTAALAALRRSGRA